MHGSSSTAESNWEALIERLSTNWRVIAPDLPGSGETEDAGGVLEIEYLAQCVEEAAASADVASYHVVGYSLGASVASVLAATRPEKVRSLVLFAGWVESKGREKFLFELWQRLFKKDRELLARFFILTGFSPAFYASASEKLLEKTVKMTLLPEGSPRHFELDSRLNLRPMLAAIEAPALVVGFRHDTYLPLSHSQDLKEAIKNAEYLELDGGHLLPYEDPNVLGDVIESFLAKRSLL